MTTLNLNVTIARRYIVILTAIVAQLAAGYASADTDRTDDVPKIVVSLAGLSLATPKGVDIAYDRIRSAAKIVCHVDQSRELGQAARARACFKTAVADAVAKIDRPLLSALHASRMGGLEQLNTVAKRI
ncbi:UrcA family protein [Steroidobacter sp.]|uniref:UrcA family protein n=1 Tax=Steroidobacter sp. TaxID=1978227 RepID=UPI001A42B4BD|nr:UrcA family protein [Steroidobacter sp.]MBL8265648.1 UrcA family protein [Steroidobacter sp.]